MDSQDKVVSLFSFKAKQAMKAENQNSLNTELAANIKPEDFNSLMKKNESNSERLRKERLKANKSVLKSYRIKH